MGFNIVVNCDLRYHTFGITELLFVAECLDPNYWVGFEVVQ